MYFSNFVTITPLLIANSRENRTHRSTEMRADNDSATCSFEGTLAVLASRDKRLGRPRETQHSRARPV